MIDWETVARVSTHPTQVRILEALSPGDKNDVLYPTSSPTRLAGQFEEPLGKVSYHVATLAKAGLIELVGTKPRRGAVEHYYQMVR